jgi:hypothetical protein
MTGKSSGSGGGMVLAEQQYGISSTTPQEPRGLNGVQSLPYKAAPRHGFADTLLCLLRCQLR